MKRIVILGGGIGGLASAALLARAGHSVTLLERNGWFGGKSRRITVGGQRIDTGPSMLTFPEIWDELLRRYDAPGGTEDTPAQEIAPLRLRRLPEVGTYHLRGETSSLPVTAEHPWRAAWERFTALHGPLGPDITRLLTEDPLDPRAFPALLRLLRLYGPRLSTRSYLDSLVWMPEGLREIVAIHTLNAGVGPSRTPALYASLPAIMARDGVWVPEGGVYEMVLALERLAHAAGADLKTEEEAVSISAGKVMTASNIYPADYVVSGLDAGVLEKLLGDKRADPTSLSCSGVAIYASLREELPEHVPEHSIVLPPSPAKLYESLESAGEPEETMSFVNYYRPGNTYPNTKATLAVLLTTPANGREYGLDDNFVRREVERASRTIGLSRPATEYFDTSEILSPHYFGEWGAAGGALYGSARPFWRSGPFHRPGYTSRKRPWLWRVGASVHPGGGIPAVLGGAMISCSRLLKKISSGT